MNEGTRRLGAAAGISLIVHLLLPLAGVLFALRDDPPTDDPSYVEVSPVQNDVDPEDVTEEEEQEDEEYEPPDSLPDGQVVDAAEAGEERLPDSSRYLATRDQVVERETRAAIRLRGAEGVAAAPSGPRAVVAPVLVPAQQRSPMVPPVEPQDLGLRPDERGDLPPRLPPSAMPSDVDLEPSVAVLSDAIRGTGLDDLRDAEDGAETLLSTVHFLHAPFFQRVKHQVEQYWRPDRAFAQHDPGGHIYGYRDRETVVRVVLEADGALERAYVIQPSGADFLDDEAVGAIRQAAPFPNPPAGLVDERSHHIVFTFGFTVEMGEQPIVRLRRYGE